jgi:hypothetical protein
METDVAKFLVLYRAPVSVIDEWKKTDAATRKPAEEKMQREWKQWMTDHGKLFTDMGAGVGKTKHVDGKGVSDTRNDILLYGMIEAESHDVAAKAFEGHPHLQIPQSSIEIMVLNPLHGMQ